HGHINWLKEGIRHADRVMTVSPTYASEICEPLGGHGLDAALRARGDEIVGILNGVDYDDWNPKSDALLPYNYDESGLLGKTLVKQALLKRAQLHVNDTIPLVGMVSRLTPQKGIDLLIDTLPEVLQQREFAFVGLGSGEARYEEFFADLTERFPDRAFFQQGYSEELAHWIEASSDMFLMPSMYEPCGLNQMYSLKYGTVPIVRRTGGLADSVQMWNGATQSGTGIVFNDFDAPAIRWALHTALDLFKDRTAWLKLMQNGMAMDFSWEQQAKEYLRLYEQMQAK
ncbi:MAG TPA: glycosyltransferase, partial [Steroidobacteraceae bacterium]|nr:glycosyltransferase [Steroidobacteraceae bacterium]